ncbi:MAG: nucleotidyl transferase AbiEii/AbiGii toxin family protein [Chloroflexota bacterium]|nr:nucleotidyl transferase AbiEii/AbiGii toxin family protein [Chloroflexota bacterium]
MLTILLERVFAHEKLRDSVALKGGTALRKLVFGSVGRFSEDMDFVTLVDNNDGMQAELIGILIDEDAAARDGVRVLEFDFEQSGLGTVQAICEFQSERGPGRFDLDITGGEERQPLLGTISQRPLQQSYFGQLGFTPSPIRRLETVEMIAEKLVSVHRRYENRNPKDVWDLWKWTHLRAANDDMKRVEHLWPVRLWLDRQRWRGPGWFKRVEGFAFDWARLRTMLPQGRVAEGNAIVRELGQRLATWIDRDDHHLLEDAAAGRHRAVAMEQLDLVRREVGAQRRERLSEHM